MKLYLLGNGYIEKDGVEVKLSFKKAYALLFYMLIEEVVPRETVVNLFWGNLSEDAAKRNLRNTVYVLRKNLDDHIIESPKRDILKINKERIDFVDIFSIETMTADAIMSFGDAIFLNGFHLKESPYFDEWMASQRYYFSEILTRRMKKLVVENIDNGKAVVAERLCKKILQFDEYDESTYRLLFRALEKQDKYTSIAYMYNQLCELLNEDLMLKPDEATKFEFEEIMMDKSRKESKVINHIYGRKEELNTLKANLYRHVRTKKTVINLLHGQYGIGKTTLLNAFYDDINGDYTILEGRCYKAEIDFPLSPWLVLLEDLRNLILELPEESQPENIDVLEKLISGDQIKVENFDENTSINSFLIERVILEWFSTLIHHKPVIVLFEDIQWMDKISLKILMKLMEKEIYIITTANTDYAPLEQYLDIFSKVDNLKLLEVKPFSKIETFELAKSLIEDSRLELDDLENVYKKSDGNPLYIVEILKVIDQLNKEKTLPKKILDIMQTRLRLLTRDEQKVLNIASNFYDYFNYEDLKSISGMDEWNLIDTLGELVKKNMLKEVKRANDMYFTFSHHLFRECVYHQLPQSIRRVYHGKIALHLEKEAGNNPTLAMIYRLVYNYGMANEPIKELKYRIQFVSDYFNSVHEMFPILGNKVNYDNDYSGIVDIKNINDDLTKIIELYNRVEEQLLNDKSCDDLRYSYYKLIGRYYNIKGMYDLAETYIEKMYDLAIESDDRHRIFNAMLQKIYYFINMRELESLEIYIEKATNLIDKKTQKGIAGVLLRLKGYSSILKGDFEKGIDILQEAICIFKSLEFNDKFLLNLVGSYYCMGEGYRFMGEMNKAMACYDKAIDICVKKGYKQKLAFLYGAKGQIYYELASYDEAKLNLKKAKEIYELIDADWGKYITLGYYGLIKLREGKYKESSLIIEEVEVYYKDKKNHYELAFMLRIKAEICYYVRENNISSPLYKEISTTDNKFCHKAINQLKGIHLTYEVELLEKMNDLCGFCKRK